MLDILHEDITYKILTDYLDIKDVIHFISYNKQTLELLKDEKLWKKLTNRDYIHFEYDNKIKWFDLYKILHKNDLFVKSRAKLHNLDKTILKEEIYERKIDDVYDEYDVLDLLNEVISEKNEKNNIYMIIKNMKKGDIIKIDFSDRDFSEKVDKYLYNGEILQIQSEGIFIPDDYPCIEEFPINYWDNILYKSNAIYFNNIYIDEIKKNIYEEDDVTKSYFIHNYAKYYIIFEYNIYYSDPEDYDNIFKKCMYSNTAVFNDNNNKYIIDNRTIFASFSDEYNDEDEEDEDDDL
jgi:hypothetical protein